MVTICGGWWEEVRESGYGDDKLATTKLSNPMFRILYIMYKITYSMKKAFKVSLFHVRW